MIEDYTSFIAASTRCIFEDSEIYFLDKSVIGRNWYTVTNKHTGYSELVWIGDGVLVRHGNVEGKYLNNLFLET